MRCKGFLLTLAIAAALASSQTAVAATFGKVVSIGGHASDIVLDESRGVLYIANFTANRIDVMSTADNTIRRSMNVSTQPGALALSPDSKYLLVAHYGSFTAPAPSRNAITLINLVDDTRQTFAMGETPLGAAFLADGRAFLVTTSSLLTLEPLTGAMDVLATFPALAKSMPVDMATFPSQVVQATLSNNPDHTSIFGIADDGEAQAFYRYDVKKGEIFAIGVVASPRPLPRISVSQDGTWAMVGQYRLDKYANDLAQFPNSITSTTIGGAAVDSRAGIIYAEILTGSSSSTSTTSSTTSITPAATPTGPPVLQILEADNLTVKERLSIPEHITGRALLNASNDTLYAITDSGVTVFAVGRLNQQHRVVASQSDVMVAGNFCDRNVIVQKLTITDPGGGNTDFQIGSSLAGVSVSPSSGVTPAVVQVRVDPNAFADQNGTVTGQLTIVSGGAVNLPDPVRLLINNRNPDQRGSVINVPGTLTDLLADPLRNRFYVVRQDKNQVLVFDGATYSQIATLRTSTTPTQMAITFDRKYLIVGHDNAQLAFVYDLDTLKPDAPIYFPSGHYPRSIAESGKATLALVRDVTGKAPGSIDRIDMAGRTATRLTSLGIYTNSVNMDGVLAPAPNGGAILMALPDGNVMLYDANADTFTVSRKDGTALAGSYAASSYNTYVVGNSLLNSSLVPQATLETASGASAGFAFVDQWGLRTTAPAVSSPGVIQHVDPAQSLAAKPTRMVESPLTATTAQPFIRSLAPLYDRSALVSLTISGITVLPWNYDAAVAPPRIQSVVNAADGKLPVAPGGLISVYGQQMSPLNLATKQIPLPTALGESCLTINGVPMPMLFVSSQQINGQLPFNVDGNATMTLRTPGGISDNFYFTILPGAPSVFRTGAAGPSTDLPTVVRAYNNELITPTNPVHPDDVIVIYATGLGRTQPAVDSGLPAPSEPLAQAILTPLVTLGGTPLGIEYAGLVPGQIGLYQINARVPFGVPLGLEIPLVISQSGVSTELKVRVVK
jgi:uncharacterized protein (TIGR03437 family)